MRPMAEVGGSLVPSPRVLDVAPMRHVTALIGDRPALTKQNADVISENVEASLSPLIQTAALSLRSANTFQC